MNYHYLTPSNQPAGPLSLDEIRTLAREGTIAADPLVCPIGGTEWKVLSSLEVAAGPAAVETAASVEPGPAKASGVARGTFAAEVVGKLARLAASVLRPARLDGTLRFSTIVGHWAMLLGAAAMLVLALNQWRVLKNSEPLLPSVIFVVILLVAQFTATRFLGTADQLIARLPSRVSSPALFDCVGLFAVLVAIAMLAFGIIGAVANSSLSPFFYYVVFAVTWGGLGAVALHPRTVGVETGDGSLGEEAIGVVAFFLKAGLRIVPLLFGLFAVLGTIVIVWGTIDPVTRVAYSLRFVEIMPLPGLLPATIGSGAIGAAGVLTAGLLPIAAYLVFLVASLPLEIARALLAGKSDASKR